MLGKKICPVALVILLLFTCMLTACQPTPEKEAVIGKNDGVLEEAIASTASPQATLAAEPDWSDEFSSADGTTQIVIRAEVNVPEENKFPVISCTPHYFTLEEANRAVKALFGNQPLYDNSVSDKESAEERVLMLRRDLESLKTTGEYPVQEDGSQYVVTDLEEEIALVEGWLKEAEEIYAEAGQTKEVKELAFSESESGSQLINIKNGENPPMTFYTFNYKDANDAAIEYALEGSGDTFPSKLEEGESLDIAISREEAEQQAIELAKECGVGDCEVIWTGKTTVDGKPCYSVSLGRLINGIPSMSVEPFGGTQALGVDGEEFREPWRQENIEVVIGDDGVMKFLWEYPPELDVTENENVQLMPWEEIKTLAKDQLQRSLSADEFALRQEDGQTITIDRVMLSMMRAAKKDAYGEYYYLPVWDFLGTAEEEMDIQIVSREKSYLTLNAIDGSVVDRWWGY